MPNVCPGLQHNARKESQFVIVEGGRGVADALVLRLRMIMERAATRGNMENRCERAEHTLSANAYTRDRIK